MRYILREFAQALPNEGVRVEIIATNANPPISSAIPCEPITGLPGDFTNEDLLEAVRAKTGLFVELPDEVAKDGVQEEVVQ